MRRGDDFGHAVVTVRTIGLSMLWPPPRHPQRDVPRGVVSHAVRASRPVRVGPPARRTATSPKMSLWQQSSARLPEWSMAVAEQHGRHRGAGLRPTLQRGDSSGSAPRQHREPVATSTAARSRDAANLWGERRSSDTGRLTTFRSRDVGQSEARRGTDVPPGLAGSFPWARLVDVAAGARSLCCRGPLGVAEALRPVGVQPLSGVQTLRHGACFDHHLRIAHLQLCCFLFPPGMRPSPSLGALSPVSTHRRALGRK